MSYTPPNGDNLSFEFTSSGYASPAGNDITFVFGVTEATEVLAPSARFSIQGAADVRIEIVIVTPPGKFNYQGSGKGTLEVVIKASPAKFNYQGLADRVYTLYIIAPPANFNYQGIVEYVSSYNPPAVLTDFINMTDARRDKAISYDKQHAFDMGPIERGNIDEGLLARPWRLRIDGVDVYLAVADNQNNKWIEEFKEFELLHSPVWSADLTFDQNGMPFACWEYDGGVYIYWYDPTIGDMDTKYVCEGRTPRARLDARARHQLPDSDIYLFYLNDAEDRMEYRIQRDRYNIAYATNVVDISNIYLEVLAMSRDWRLFIWMSEYLPENEGTHEPAYHLIWRHSAVYPYYFVEEIEVGADAVIDARHVVEYLLADMKDEEITYDGDSIISAFVRSFMHTYTLLDPEITYNGDDIINTTIRQAIHLYTIGDDSELEYEGDEVVSAAIRQAIIEENMKDEEITYAGDSVMAMAVG